MKYDICSLGNAIVDITFQIETEFQEKLISKGISPRSMTLIDSEDQDSLLNDLKEFSKEESFMACGGSATNTIIAASNFGSNCYYSCRVSDDEFGNFYLKDLLDNKISFDTIPSKSDLPTGRCVVMVTPDAERTMCTNLGISGEVSQDFINEDSIKNSTFLYLEGYLVTAEKALEAAIKSADIAQKNEVKIAISLSDPNIASIFKNQFLEILKRKCNLIFCNELEAMSFTETKNLKQSIERLRVFSEQGLITTGQKGCIAWNQKEALEIPTSKVEAIDSNGAGDMFAGAVLNAICDGKTLNQSAKFGCFAASEKVKKSGPRVESGQYKKIKEDFYT
tara:strand:- start:15512 stop:16519 length:1008 start_codon:yes stop_codon:yes gene_type:complete